MVYYGDEKRRQMARSILPSRGAKTARRDKRHAKQRNRQRIRQELRRVLRDEDHEVADDVDLRAYPDGEIRIIVSERRDADKLRHFEKWAVEVTKDIAEPDGRLAKMRSILPKGLIGEHAISHLRNWEEFDRDVARLERSARYAEESARWAEHRRHVRERRPALLAEIIKTGWGHRALNVAMVRAHRTVLWTVTAPTTVGTKLLPGGKTREVVENQTSHLLMGPRRPRLVRGLGDIDAFLADVGDAARAHYYVEVEPYIDHGRFPALGRTRRAFVWEHLRGTRANPEHHPEWLKALDDFLDAWEASRGDRDELRRLVPTIERGGIEEVRRRLRERLYGG